MHNDLPVIFIRLLGLRLMQKKYDLNTLRKAWGAGRYSSKNINYEMYSLFAMQHESIALFVWHTVNDYLYIVNLPLLPKLETLNIDTVYEKYCLVPEPEKALKEGLIVLGGLVDIRQNVRDFLA